MTRKNNFFDNVISFTYCKDTSEKLQLWMNLYPNSLPVYVLRKVILHTMKTLNSRSMADIATHFLELGKRYGIDHERSEAEKKALLKPDGKRLSNVRLFVYKDEERLFRVLFEHFSSLYFKDNPLTEKRYWNKRGIAKTPEVDFLMRIVARHAEELANDGEFIRLMENIPSRFQPEDLIYHILSEPLFNDIDVLADKYL